MNENQSLNLTPVHVVGAISIEAKQVAAMIDTAAAKGAVIDLEAIKTSINRMVALANAVVSPTPATDTSVGE